MFIIEGIAELLQYLCYLPISAVGTSLLTAHLGCRTSMAAIS